VITSIALGGGNTTINGSLNSTPSTVFTLEFFHTYYCDISGHGEGKTYLGQASVTTNSGGDVSFQAILAGQAPSGSFVAATATSPAGNTSEFSACAPSVNDSDDDDDGYADTIEATIGTNPRDPCGSDGWPSNLIDPLPPSPANTLDIFDVTSFLGPVRRLDTDLSAFPNNNRWDLIPGPDVFLTDINIGDLTALFTGDNGSGAYPPMFGERAFDKTCPFPP
jgi:hypothetical protein